MTFIATLLLLLVPFLLSGTFHSLAIYVVFITTLLLFVASRFDRRIQRTIPNIAFIAFFVFLLIFLPFSQVFVRSVPVIIWWLGYLGVFLFCQCLAKEDKFIANISKVFVILTAGFGIASIYNFILLGLTSYTRLNSFIGTHNVYGGFLIIPFFLSVYLIFSEETKWQKYLWLLSGSIIFSSLILTYSRGTWVSIVAGVIVSAMVFSKIPRSFALLRSTGLPRLIGRSGGFFGQWRGILILLILTLLITVGIWFLAKLNTKPAQLSDAAVFSMQDAETNAFTARLHYFNDAWHTFLQKPFTGFGVGNYGSALRIYKTDPNYGSFADPHNWLLKMLVEQGLIVTTIFVIFIASLFWQMRGLIIRRRRFSWLAVSIYAALIAGTIHGLTDFDWGVNNLLLIFFVFAGLLYGFLLNDRATDYKNEKVRGVTDYNNEKDNSASVSYLPKWLVYILVILIIGASIISIQLLRSDMARAKGDIYLLTNRDADNAINSYFESASINSHDPTTWYDLWRVYFLTKNYVAALNCINKAINIFPQSGSYYLAKAVVYEAAGDATNYRENLLNAIKYFPASDLNAQVRLVELDVKNGKYDEALYVINEVLPIYAKYEKALWFKSDPNSGTIDENLIKLNDFNDKIEKSR